MSLSLNIPQTVLALRGSDGFSRDLWRLSGVRPRSLSARSCCKNRYLVTLTFASLERNRWSRAQTHKNSILFDSLLLRQDRCLSSSHLSCLNSRHLSCLNRRHLSCLDVAPGCSWLLQAGMDQKVVKKHRVVCVFEIATPYSVREGRRSVSPSIDFYNNFSHPSSAG